MNTSKIIVVLMLIMSLALIRSTITKTKDPAPLGEVGPAYMLLTRTDLEGDTRLTAWFAQYHRTEGIHTTELEEDTYVLISAGPKPTGGYGLSLTSITQTKPQELLITVELKTPSPGDMVTMAFTYPNIVLRFLNQTYEKIEMELNEPDQLLQRVNTIADRRMGVIQSHRQGMRIEIR